MNQFLNSSVNLNVTFNGSIALKTDVYGVSQEPHITAEESDLCQADSYPYQDYTQLQWVHALFILSYLLIIFLSVTGNLMVIWTICRNKHMRTVTNYYILNLAVSDFLVSVFVMPLKLLEYTAPCQWHIFNHRFLCSFLYYVLPIFVFASVLTLLAISIERYYAIVHPLAAMKLHSKSRTRKILAATWIVPMFVASPYLYCKSYPFNIWSTMGSISRQICTDRFDDIDGAISGDGATGYFRKGYFLFLFFIIYLVPLAVMVLTCVRIAICLLHPIVEKPDSAQGRRITRRREENKRRVARMIIVVALVFLVSWTPFYIVIFVSQVQENSFLKQANFIFTMLATHLIGFLNSCINPFIYNLMSEKFRKSFIGIITALCFCCCSKHFIRMCVSFKSQADSATDYYGQMSPGGQPSCSDDQSSSLMVKVRGKQKSPDTVLVKMSPLGNSKSNKENGNSQCIIKYSPLSLHKMATGNDKECSTLRKINLLSSLQPDDLIDNIETAHLKDDLPVDISHNHARLVEDNMAPESNGALSAPKPNIVVQRTVEKIELVS